jgi:AcrR family transcriptional regulator
MILDAGRTVFSRDGFEASSVEDVAAEAGIAKGTVYLYFKSKEELYLAVLLRDIKAYAANSRARMEQAPTLRDKIEAYFRARMEYGRANKDFLRIYLTEYAGMCAIKPISQEMRTLQLDNLKHLTGLIKTAIRRGEIRRVPPAALAAKVSDIARGLMERQLLGWKEFQVKNEVAFAADLLWHGVSPQDRTPRNT